MEIKSLDKYLDPSQLEFGTDEQMLKITDTCYNAGNSKERVQSYARDWSSLNNQEVGQERY